MQIISNGEVCMKCQILFSENNNNKKKTITNLSSAEFAQRVVKVKLHILLWSTLDPDQLFCIF